MSIGFVGLHQLLPALRHLQSVSEARVLLLGTQDLHFTFEQAADFFSRHDVAVASVPETRRRQAVGFGFVSDDAWSEHRRFLHHETLFEMLGVAPARVDVIDISPFEGANIVHDLNLPLSRRPPYDLVLDQGTMEHIFDVRQVLWTLSEMTQIGGEVIHMAPAGFLNHGFYNFNATLFKDFYGQSGWRKEELYYSLVPKSASIDQQSLYGRICPDSLSSVPEDFYLNVFSRFRREAGAAPVRPVQGFYRSLHAKTSNRPLEPSPASPPSKQVWADAVVAHRAHDIALEGLRRLGADVSTATPPPSVPVVDLVTATLDSASVQPAGQLTFMAALPDVPLGDSCSAPRSSQLMLFEDGAPLASAHAMHVDIEKMGGGRFSHWHDYIYFSTPDGSSPLTNGRRYSVAYPTTWA